jgi:hypothetical protein
MKKINWLITDGLAEISETQIKYIPQPDESGNTKYLIVNSDIEFENGEVEFDVVLSDKRGRCQLILSSDLGTSDLNVGLNTISQLYGIIRWDYIQKVWETLSSTGDPESIVIGQVYNLKVKVVASEIGLYVNGILVVRAYRNVRKSQLKFALQGSSEIIISNFKVNNIQPTAFIVMQFSDEYNQLYEEVIKPVCEAYGILCERADEYYSTNMIIEDIVKSIRESSVIIADITPDNPNVFYEVGYAHAINKPTILLCEKKRGKLPFDISSFRTLFYDNTIAGKRQIETRLRKYLDNIFK